MDAYSVENGIHAEDVINFMLIRENALEAVPIVCAWIVVVVYMKILIMKIVIMELKKTGWELKVKLKKRMKKSKED